MASMHIVKHLKWLTNTHNSIRVLRFMVWDLEAGNEANMEGDELKNSLIVQIFKHVNHNNMNINITHWNESKYAE